MPGNAEQVIGWINKPNSEHGFLRTPITQAILEQFVTRDGWNGDHLSAMQAQDESGQYMWFKDRKITEFLTKVSRQIGKYTLQQRIFSLSNIPNISSKLRMTYLRDGVRFIL